MVRPSKANMFWPYSIISIQVTILHIDQLADCHLPVPLVRSGRKKKKTKQYLKAAYVSSMAKLSASKQNKKKRKKERKEQKRLEKKERKEKEKRRTRAEQPMTRAEQPYNK